MYKRQAFDEEEAIGEDEVRKANDLLQKYKAGKAALDKRKMCIRDSASLRRKQRKAIANFGRDGFFLTGTSPTIVQFWTAVSS